MSSSDEDEEVYEVEQILDHKTMKNGRKKYFVRWKNYGPNEDSWEDQNNLEGCQELLKEYWDSVAAAETKKTKTGTTSTGNGTTGSASPSKQVAKTTKTGQKEKRIEVDDKSAGDGDRSKRLKSETLKETYTPEIAEKETNGEESWEGVVQGIEEVDKDEDGKLWFLVSWNDGRIPSWIPSNTAYAKFPMFMLRWYEARIRFKHV